MLPPILPLKDHFYDFPVYVLFTYKSDSITGRQSIYLSKTYSFLSMYNYSDFLKMHFHNAWLLGMPELIIDLPEEFFESPGHLFLFCGTFPFLNLCTDNDISNFDFCSMLFASSYLMIEDSFLIHILNTISITSYKENVTILPSLYSLMIINYDLP